MAIQLNNLKINITCSVCSVVFFDWASNNRQFCSRACFYKRLHTQETYNKVSISNKGKTAWNKGVAMTDTAKVNLSRYNKEHGILPPSQWKGDDIQYSGLHRWLRDKYGKANRCESDTCLHNSSRYEYAKIQGKGYERKRENFMMLCKSCHTKYDMTDAWRAKIIPNLIFMRQKVAQ